jgi:hypothetical protein
MSSKMIEILRMSTVSIDNKQSPGDPHASPELAEQILRAVASVRFGSVELVIHEGQIAQIERREKLRLDRRIDGGAAG